MEITWYGLSCFRLTERGAATVVTDPYNQPQAGAAPLKLAADIVTISHDAPAYNYLEAINGSPYVITGPGEYEVGGVFITGIQTGSHKVTDHEQNGSHFVQRNTLYVFDYDGLTIAHLGDLDHVPTQAEIEAVGTVNVAFVPIGSTHGLSAARATEVIGMLEPNIVIPMHYDPTSRDLPLEALSKFLKEMGLSEINTQPSLKISSPSLPEETKVIVLDNRSG